MIPNSRNEAPPLEDKNHGDSDPLTGSLAGTLVPSFTAGREEGYEQRA
ncbi:hypothetical protein BH23ACT12_BH23ACT12_23550 [soil metagenome]